METVDIDSAAELPTSSSVWQFDTKLQCTKFFNSCKQTFSDVGTVINLMYQF